MITLFNRAEVPRGGYSYYYLPSGRPEAALTVPNGTSLAVSKKLIIAYRSSNPWLNLPADEASVERDLILYTYARLKTSVGLKYTLKFFKATRDDDPDIAQAEIEVKKNETLTLPTIMHKLKDVADVADDFKDVMRSWLGDSLRPVSQEQAQGRANICLECPLNEPGNWIERLAAGIAGVAKKFVEIKNQMKLHVDGEEKLFMCRGCRCVLETKVHVPIEHIKAGTSAVTIEKLREGKNCWQIREMGLL